MTDAAVATAPTTSNTGGAAAPNPSGAGGEGAASTAVVSRAGLMSDGGADQGSSNGSASMQRSNGSGNGQAREIVMEQDANGDWRQSFTTGLDEDTGKTWGNIVQRYNSPSDLAKAHVSLVRSMDQRIAVPGENAKPEEWDQVYNKLGRPEKPDGYKFEFPADAPWDDTDKQRYKEMAPLFHRAGATQKQLTEYLTQQAQVDKMMMDAAAAKAADLQRQKDAVLKQQWGADWKENRAYAKSEVERQFGKDTPEVDRLASMRLADGTFVLDDPLIANMLARNGRERGEDTRDPTSFAAGRAQNVRAEIETLESDALAKGYSPTHPNWPHQKLEALYAKLPGANKNSFKFGHPG